MKRRIYILLATPTTAHDFIDLSEPEAERLLDAKLTKPTSRIRSTDSVFQEPQP